MMKTIFVLLGLSVSLRAEVIDRVAVAIGYRPITELEIDEELTVTAFLNHEAVVEDKRSRHDAADRLIQQFLIERDMQVSGYPMPAPAEVQTYFQQIERDFGGSVGLETALKSDGLNETTLLRHLSVQLAILRFVAIRFRPEFSVSDSDVQAYLKSEPATAPHDPASIRRQILEQRTDQALAVWLKETRKQFRIVYLDSSLQ